MRIKEYQKLNRKIKSYECDDLIVYFYEDTGEIVTVENGHLRTESQVKRDREYGEKERRRTLDIENENIRLKSKNLELKKVEKNESKFEEDFIWMYFKQQQRLFPELSPQDITKLIYLSTYCSYNTNILVESGTPIKKKNLTNIMMLEKSQYFDWINKMQRYNYLEFKEDIICLNNTLFSKGKLKTPTDSLSIRIFVYMVQKLYKNITPKDHIKMGHAIHLIPFMNLHFNVLSSTPYETDISKVKLLRISDYTDALGCTPKQCKRILNELVTFRWGKERRTVVTLLAEGTLEVKKMVMILDSELFFGGTHKEFDSLTKLVGHLAKEYVESERSKI